MSSIEVIRAGGPLWTIRADYTSKALSRAAYGTPGIQWDSKTRSGTGYVDGVLTVIRRLEAEGIRVRAGSLPTRPSSDHNLPAALKDARDYQKAGINFLIANAESGALLADDMGVGKSLQAARAARALRGKVVIVTLAYGKHVWVDEIAKWWPAVAKNLQVLSGVKDITPIDPDTQIVVINYDIVYAWEEALLKWVADPISPPKLNGPTLDAPPLIGLGDRFGLIIDEIHLVSNAESRRGQALHRIRKAAAWCVGLSGTPLTNKPVNLFGVIELISPGRMSRVADNPISRFFPYGLRYCGGHQVEISSKED